MDGRTISSSDMRAATSGIALAPVESGTNTRKDGRDAKASGFATFVSSLQLIGLGAAILVAIPSAKGRAGLNEAHFIASVILLSGFAIQSGYWACTETIAGLRGVAKGIIRRGAQAAALALLSTFAAIEATGVAWDTLAPLQTFVLLLAIVVAGVIVLAITERMGRDAVPRCVVIFGNGDPALRLAEQVRTQLPTTTVCLCSAGEVTTATTCARSASPFHISPRLIELSPDVVIMDAPETMRAVAAHVAPLPVDVLVHLPRGGSSSTGPIVTFAGLSFVRVYPKPLRGYQAALKRGLDLLGSMVLLLALSPLLVGVAFAIKLDSRGPVFFRQPRVGAGGAHFTVFKFRTMRVDACDVLADQLTARNDPRVTRLGAYLRKTSIDELPQLLNVLFGSMSLVGPRPHALNAKADGDLYGEVVGNYQARHRVKPGITGLAQVLGWRGPTDTRLQIEQRVANDLKYISEWSLGQDVVIIVRTLFALSGHNAV
jgi:exopolysaccharide biosynthesis polyprenyl glycosylphosphotransferase